MTVVARLLLAFCILLYTAPLALACGADSQCKLGNRHYYIAMPPGHDGRTPVPALIFAHGLQGTALGTMKNSRLRTVAADLGIALIGVKSAGVSWAQENAPRYKRGGQRKELAYFDAVVADATKRFAIDKDRIVMGGASTGGMITWGLACHRSDTFAAFIPMSGTFWAPHPPSCDGRVANIVHFHGDKDQTVPLEGRAVAGTRQGSVPQALAMYTKYGNFGPTNPTRSGDLRCENRKNRAGNVLNFCLYDGKHSFRSTNVGVAWKMLRAAGQL